MPLRPDPDLNKSQGKYFFQLWLRHIFESGLELSFVVLKRRKTCLRKRYVLGESLNIFPMSLFHDTLVLPLYKANENDYCIFLIQPLLALCTMTSCQVCLWCYLKYQSVKAGEWRMSTGHQLQCWSPVLCTSFHAKTFSYFSSQTWLPSTSFPATVHPNGFILSSSRQVGSQSSSKHWSVLHILSHSLKAFFTCLHLFYCLLIKTEKRFYCYAK